MKKLLRIAFSTASNVALLLCLSSCSNEAQPKIDVDYEARLIEYEACVQASTTKWQELAPDLQTDALLGIVKKECEKYRP